jgi:hypothetical protein
MGPIITDPKSAKCSKDGIPGVERVSADRSVMTESEIKAYSLIWHHHATPLCSRRAPECGLARTYRYNMGEQIFPSMPRLAGLKVLIRRPPAAGRPAVHFILILIGRPPFHSNFDWLRRIDRQTAVKYRRPRPRNGPRPHLPVPVRCLYFLGQTKKLRMLGPVRQDILIIHVLILCGTPRKKHFLLFILSAK